MQSYGGAICRLHFLHKISVCQNAALKECFYRTGTDVDYLFYEYNVNFTFSLSAVSDALYRKFCDILVCDILVSFILFFMWYDMLF